MRGQQGFVFQRAQAAAGAGVFAVVDVDHHGLRPCTLAQRCRAPAPMTAANSRSVISTLVSQWCICQASSVRVEPGVQRVEHGIERRHGVVRLHHLGRVGQHHADGAAAAHAQRTQRSRQAG
jgi:hypothetical protein